ncbi:hypothetical protein Tco_0204446 [Tanacetum coccineum]
MTPGGTSRSGKSDALTGPLITSGSRKGLRHRVASLFACGWGLAGGGAKSDNQEGAATDGTEGGQRLCDRNECAETALFGQEYARSSWLGAESMMIGRITVSTVALWAFQPLSSSERGVDSQRLGSNYISLKIPHVAKDYMRINIFSLSQVSDMRAPRAYNFCHEDGITQAWSVTDSSSLFYLVFSLRQRHYDTMMREEKSAPDATT